MASRTARALLVLVLLLSTPLLARAEKQPANAHLLDVTAYGAIPNDGLDDYPALKLAMGQYDGFNGNTIYFPCGTYDFSDTIEFRDWTGTKLGTPPNDNWPWTVGIPWMGERQNCVTIKLADNATGFGDPNSPKSFIMTGSLVGPSSSDKGLTGNQGNGAYQNSIEDVTIDCGTGNPGARCLDWLASNAGEIHNVTVKSDDGLGVAGVYLGRSWPGPCMLYNVTVQGFGIGIHLLQSQYSVTFLKDTVTNQHVAGMFIGGNMASIDSLTSTQSEDVPAISNNDGGGQIELLNSTLTGPGGGTHSAIETHASAKYYVENVTTSGYPSAIKKGTTVKAANGTVAQSESDAPYKLFNAPEKSLPITVEYPPDPYWSDPDVHPEEWASPLDYGAGNGSGGETNNDVAGIQAAMNSGKPIIYFPKLGVTAGGAPAGGDGIYSFMGPTITVPGTVRRVIFNRNSLFLKKVNYPTENDCVFTVTGTSSDPPVEFNYMRRSGDSIPPAKHICNKSSGRTMVIRSSPSSLNYLMDGNNKNFIVDVIGGFKVSGGAKLFAWQLNQENGAGSSLIPPTMFVDGSGTQVYNVGMKTEADFTVTRVTGGAQYKLAGGFTFPCIGTGTNPVTSDGFFIQDSQASISFLQYCTKSPAIQGYVYPVAIKQIIGPVVRVFSSTQLNNFINCCSNRVYAPLFNGYPNSDVRIYPVLSGGPPVVNLPRPPRARTYQLVKIDPAGVTGISMDPGMWTQPASCRGMNHATITANKTGDGILDVDIYTCAETVSGPKLGSFDPQTPATAIVPTNCRNLTSDVVMDGVGTDPGTVNTVEYEGAMSNFVARLINCTGDCSAQVNVSCSPN